ncbi:alpha/beta fold hydrolase [Dyadobacter subterraneus]|uniref:Alpha/beta fold hydrolase n=1 Tax=Dyadobacter subterraneus TaxID=2773304 RepID=A0ABR9WKT0_9BACT|nr:alpha/beta fold hydrolase [Dyadobacter subterraneus]MBE9466106.1 alpha/beta fold hydrolase [Dyadobacter subterraneus]
MSEIKILHYHKLGRGPKILLAFHGIGQTGLTCFKSFSELLGDHYTIYAFDLFFHGQSKGIYGNDAFSEQDIVTKILWKKLISDFLEENQINRFDIAAFSMGGRFALATMESFSTKIDNAFLIAPDGVSEHLLYTLASRFWPTRKLFHWVLKHPDTLIKSANIFEKLGLIHKSLIRFTQFMLSDPKRQETIYRSWLAFRMLKFDISVVYKKLVATRVYLFIGKHDKLLKAKDVEKLSEFLPDNQYFLLAAGHGNLVEKAAVKIQELMD